ncbi:MAG: hypothetical protein J1E81_06475 [Eubacterium sp.]|nr:hypothetical protein [Eubacterium sp.]
MIKVLGIVIISLIAIIILKEQSKHFALIVTICVIILVFSFSLDSVSAVFEKLRNIAEDYDYMGSYLTLLMKILGITLAAQFTADLCRDSGENALANQTEMFSKIAILVMTLPLFETMMNIVTGLLK